MGDDEGVPSWMRQLPSLAACKKARCGAKRWVKHKGTLVGIQRRIQGEMRGVFNTLHLAKANPAYLKLTPKRASGANFILHDLP